MNGTNIFGNAPMMGGGPRRGDGVRRHRPLHLDEVRRPVAETEHEPETEDDPDHRQHRVVETGQLVLGAGRSGDLGLEPVPATHLVQADQGQRQQAGDDDEELQHLVVDGGREPAKGDIGEHDSRGDDQREPQRPAEQHIDDGGQQIQVDPGDEHLREGEADGVDQMGPGAESAAHELRDAAHLGAVVERHHHHTEEQHRRYCTNPEVVHGGHAVLGTVGRHPDDLDGTEVGRDKRQPGDPRRKGPAGKEEVDAGGHPSFGGDSDQQDKREVDGNHRVIDESRVEAQRVTSGEHHDDLLCSRAAVRPLSSGLTDTMRPRRWRRAEEPRRVE